MKKSRMLACILMSVVMVLMCCVPTFTALAADGDDDGKYTITITPKDKAEHTFEAYQIFTGTLLGETTADGETKTYLGGIEWGNGVDPDALLTALAANTTAFNVENDEGETVNAFANCAEAPDPAAAVAAVLNDQVTKKDFYDAFADVAKDCLTAEKYTGTCDNGTAATIEVPEGYYLVKDEDGSLANSEGAYTDFILKVVKDVEVAAKSDVPSVDKKIVEGEDKVTGNTASIGDTISYEITSKVPNMEGYNKYFFIMNDTMDKGLTLDAENGVVITIGDKVLEADTETEKNDYKLTIGTDDAGATTLKIVFRNFVEYNTGDAVVVTYNAVLNKDANITTKGNENKVDLTFSNNPNHTYKGKPGDPEDPEDPEEPDEPDPGDPEDPENPGEPTGKTPEKKVTTYTTGIELIKIDGANGKRLAGAQFQISGTKLNTILTTTYTYVEKADEDDAEGGYFKKKDGTFTTNAEDEDRDDDKEYTRVVTTAEMLKEDAVNAILEVGADGVLIIKGLNAGEYKIEEVKAPEGGYNMLNGAITVNITGEVDQTALTCDWNVITKLNDATLETVLDNDVYAFNIKNHKGILLPDAGAIGTTILYMLGAASLIASFLYFRSRRKALHK